MDALESVKQPLTRGIGFVQECWAELKKVHFPNRKETQAATIAVILGVTIVALYLGLVDFVLSWLLRRVLA